MTRLRKWWQNWPTMKSQCLDSWEGTVLSCLILYTKNCEILSQDAWRCSWAHWAVSYEWHNLHACQAESEVTLLGCNSIKKGPMDTRSDSQCENMCHVFVPWSWCDQLCQLLILTIVYTTICQQQDAPCGTCSDSSAWVTEQEALLSNQTKPIVRQ